VMDIEGLLAFAQQRGVGLTVVGPEAPLVAGIVDAFAAQSLPVFGPTQAAAQLEGSKVFAKRFMLDHGIPTGRAEWFTAYDDALAYLRRVGAPIVVKASGLAAGKGVTVCDTVEHAERALRAAMVERVFGDAGAEVLIEECLTGQEASLLAFCDGTTVAPMVVAQDHKAAYDGDRGPNTGGMGCYAPAPLMPQPLIERVTREVLQPVVDGMRAQGMPYAGVLYAGLMLAAPGGGESARAGESGFRVLEFNCRFGDPEAQVILPLLKTDLLDILLACVEGRLAGVNVRWRDAYATCVVLASGGYPGSYRKGQVLSGLGEAGCLSHDNSVSNVVVFHAGTRREGAQTVTNGGRVLGVTAVAPTLAASIERAYAGVKLISFEGMEFRTDIGKKGLPAETG
jgi:phosphoribosylamine--glycine ligase